MSTFVACCLLALPPSDCPGDCHSPHHVPLLGRHVLPALDGEFDWNGDYGASTAGEGFVVPLLPEPAAPLVLLRSLEVGAVDQLSFLASSDQPAYWTVVPFGQLSVEVQVPLAEFEPATVEYVVLLLDGKPVENNRFQTGAQPASFPSPDGQLRTAYVFNFPCPAPGKHIVQARSKLGGLWSRISEPLYFEVRLPDPPRIVAISDVGGVPVPVRGTGLVSITKPEVIVRLANVSPNASVVAYLDGKPISTALAQESCCRTLRLQGHLTPGIHALRLRTVTSGGSCSVTSEPSQEVVFHYYDEDVYLLRPGENGDNGRTTAKGKSLDRDASADYTITDKATSSDGSSSTASFTIAVRADALKKSEAEAKDAQTQARDAVLSAQAEEAAADWRIEKAEAEARIARAEAVTSPLSPFYFASAAYFPIRQFGVQGQVLEREGAVIYEDMAFSFDREGNYNVRFTVGTPAVPTTIQLRFLIQPCPGGPWYTITLEPIGFPPTKIADGKYTPSVFRNHVVEGQSEVLRRCYGEMGQNATIRREGTARFGFGLAGLSQSNAD